MPSKIDAGPPLKVASPPAKPLLLWDADCNFCRKWIFRWRAATGDRVDYETSLAAGDRFPEIPKEEFSRSVQLVEPDGRVYRGAEAVFRARAKAPGRAWPLWCYERVPGVAPISESAYAVVAGHRKIFSAVTQALWGNDVTPPTYETARRIFIRLLAATYLIAFVSLWVQIGGLAGSRGILPAEPFLEAVKGKLGGAGYLLYPTVCWLGAGDGTLSLVCGVGAVLSAVLMLTGLAPSLIFFLLWILYLSLSTVTRTFLAFQWDILLLEAGFLAIFLAPPQLRPRRERESPPGFGSIFLLHWLLFRLMFTSGVVKLGAPTPEWRNLTALDVHYETQPLPTWTAWYMHQLPHAFQAASTIFMFAIELGAPWLIFAPRRLRHAGAAALIVLQVLILATGNYAFFNLLALALCVLLLDDTFWPLRWRRMPPGGGGASRTPRRWPKTLLLPLGILIFAVSTMEMTDRMRVEIPYPSALRSVQEWLSPFRSVNSYGLFASMTTYRHEIVVQGSDDGVTWLDYEFKWKPGDLRRRPAFVAPHQPRLDWQMWFAALGTYQRNPWLISLLQRLLEGSPPVLALLDRNPFPDAPPKEIRAVVYDYHFTDPGQRAKDGAWWRREFLGLYCPVLSARNK